MGISSNLTGTPWHVDRFVRKEGDPKRHRSRCAFYYKSDSHRPLCSKYGHCIGSAHCRFYRERTRENEIKVSTTGRKSQGKSTLKSIEKSMEKRVKQTRVNQKPFPVGSFVKHQAFGTGHIKSIKGKYVRIEFDSGKTADFDIDICLSKRVLRVISL